MPTSPHEISGSKKKKTSVESERDAMLSQRLSVSRFPLDADPFGVRDLVTVKDLFNARVHFGHKAGVWNRRMKPYLYGIRNGIHIFNLDTTLVNLHRALNVAGHIAYQHGIILFVNERPQFEVLTQLTARHCGEYFVTDWVPGTLTNSYKLLKTLISPDLIIFLSVPKSKSAVKESVTHGVPAVGVVDSDCNPNFILYPVPGNDDTPQSVNLYCELFSEVILRAKRLRVSDEEEARREVEMEIERKKTAESELDAELTAQLHSIYHGNKKD